MAVVGSMSEYRTRVIEKHQLDDVIHSHECFHAKQNRMTSCFKYVAFKPVPQAYIQIPLDRVMLRLNLKIWLPKCSASGDLLKMHGTLYACVTLHSLKLS